MQDEYGGGLISFENGWIGCNKVFSCSYDVERCNGREGQAPLGESMIK